jgi:hypothetical protein
MPTLLNTTLFDVEDFGEEIVLVNLETGVYFTAKGSGPAVLRALRAGLAPETLYRAVEAQSGAERASEVRAFTEQLLAEGILTGNEPAEAPACGASGLALDEAPILQKFDDVSDLIKLDPIHDVSDLGWPHTK